jgi:hypothetical protein
VRAVENEELMSESNRPLLDYCDLSGLAWDDGGVEWNPKWATETVRALAKGIEADQAFDRMPILADALEEAGCDNWDWLNHCRNYPVHSPQCFVLSLIRHADVFAPPPVTPPSQDPPMFSAPVKARPSPPSPWAIGTFILCMLILAATAVIRGCLAGR